MLGKRSRRSKRERTNNVTIERKMTKGMWILRLTSLLLLLFTLLPLARTGSWFVRGWDFPRLQLCVFLLVVALISGFLFWHSSTRKQPSSDRNHGSRELLVWCILLSAACAWQASHVIVFTPLFSPEVGSSKSSEVSFDVMIANLKFENENYKSVANEIRAGNPSILVLIEVNDSWRRGLDELRQEFSFHHEVLRDDGLGIAIWSHLKIESAETKFIVEDIRPSIWAKIDVGGDLVNLVAVHPTPPGLRDKTGTARRDSRVRDAELISIAKHVADTQDEHWIIAGDFNDVAWSHTTRLFKRISGLKDPRVGRSFMGTFHADYPLLRFPIDHIFLSDGFTIGSLSRRKITGSDHYAVSSKVSLCQPDAGVTPEPQRDDKEDAEELIEEGVEDAKERDVQSDESDGL